MRIVLFILGAVLLVASGCGGGAGGAREDVGTSVVASFYPLAFAARQVAGVRAEISNLTAAGVEPHDLELTARQAREIAEADAVLYLGGGFQPAVEAAVAGRAGLTLDLLEGQDLRPEQSAGAGRAADGDDDRHGIDPHVWLDPTRFAAIVRTIGKAFGRPRAAAALEERLEDLDREFRLGLARCARRTFVTGHASFGYLAARYGLRQVALAGVAPEAEPGPRSLERLVREVKRTGAAAVFSERLVPADLVRTVAREAGVAVGVLDPLEGLTADEAATGADYFSVMRENLAALRGALGCR